MFPWSNAHFYCFILQLSHNLRWFKGGILNIFKLENEVIISSQFLGLFNCTIVWNKGSRTIVNESYTKKWIRNKPEVTKQIMFANSLWVVWIASQYMYTHFSVLFCRAPTNDLISWEENQLILNMNKHIVMTQLGGLCVVYPRWLHWPGFSKNMLMVGLLFRTI